MLIRESTECVGIEKEGVERVGINKESLLLNVPVHRLVLLILIAIPRGRCLRLLRLVRAPLSFLAPSGLGEGFADVEAHVEVAAVA